VPWHINWTSPLMVRLRVEVKGVQNVNLFEGTLRLLCVFRAYFLDPKLAWTNYELNSTDGKTKTTCGEIKKRNDTNFSKNFPDAYVCVKKITALTSSS
jgi:hypothetical protein